MADYVNELNAVVEVADARHIRVTNGGITSQPLDLLTWQDYVDLRHAGARRPISRRGCSATSRRSCGTCVPSPLPASTTSFPPGRLGPRASSSIPAYRQSAIDYVNFHWYIDDDEALAQKRPSTISTEPLASRW